MIPKKNTCKPCWEVVSYKRDDHGNIVLRVRDNEDGRFMMGGGFIKNHFELTIPRELLTGLANLITEEG